MITVAKTYLDKLNEKYLSTTGNIRKKYDKYLKKKKPITDEELDKLVKKYPEIPEGLIELLKFFDVHDCDVLYSLNSDIDKGKFSYYLVRFDEMYKSENYFKYYEKKDIDKVIVDDRISKNIDKNNWLLFANCMNNGGTSTLWIDFTPSKKGKVGQVLRFVHDNDRIEVLADSFDEYLNKVINSKFIFVDDYGSFLNEYSEKQLKKMKKNEEKLMNKIKNGVPVKKNYSKFEIIFLFLFILFVIFCKIIGKK